jgi:hypothetical protein
MAKYIPMELLLSLSGKLCGHSDVYFANRNGTLYTGKICNPFTGEPSALQIAQRNKFKQVVIAIAALTQEEKDAYETAFRKQKEYKTLRGYMFAQEYAKLGD